MDIDTILSRDYGNTYDVKYSDVLSIYLNAVLQGDTGTDYVLVEGKSAAVHKFISNKLLANRPTRIDPTGHLFSRPRTFLYNRYRVNGIHKMYVYPQLYEYVKSREKKSNRQKGGGCVVGEGKEGSFVFDADVKCIKEAFSINTDVVVVEVGYDGSEVRYDNKWSRGRYLLKYNVDDTDTADELDANVEVHNMMSVKHFDHMTSLDDKIKYVYALEVETGKLLTEKLIVMRRFDGDIHTPNIRDNMTKGDFFAISKTVLIFLNILHTGGYVHLDIKPHNILYGKAKNANEQNIQKDTYVLADYGVMISFDDVLRVLKKGSFSGTYRYLSPIFVCQNSEPDKHNHVYPAFKRMYFIKHNESVKDDVLTRMFLEERNAIIDDGDIVKACKLDLHSLGLTMYNIANQRGLLKDGTVCLFLYGLLFSDAGTFKNAYMALEFLCKHAVRCDEIDLKRH
jgi:serine/threonine protein kinase